MCLCKQICSESLTHSEENESVGEVSTVCSQIVLKCLYLARIGRPDFKWSVIKLARAVTTRTKSCHRRLAFLILFFHHPSESRQYCYVGRTAQKCRLGLFQDAVFAGDLEDSKTTSGGILCIFRNWMCNTQFYRSCNHFSRSIPALTLWDLVIDVFHLVPNRTDGPKRDPWRNPSAVIKPKHA